MTKNIHLRALEPSDIDVLYGWENDKEVWNVSNTLTPFSRYQLEQYILNASVQDIFTLKQLRLIIEVESEGEQQVVGTIDLFDFDPQHSRAGVGILIEKKEREKGYAQEALKELIYYAFYILNLHQLFCNINSQNEKSIHVFESLGFEKTGLKKDWLLINQTYQDEYILQLIRKDL